MIAGVVAINFAIATDFSYKCVHETHSHTNATPRSTHHILIHTYIYTYVFIIYIVWVFML